MEKIRKTLILAFLCFLALSGVAQNKKYSTFYYQRATLFEVLPVDSDDIVFLGNSITNGAEWGELLGNANVKNRGISGDVTLGVYDRLDAILKGHPAKIFLMIGINDLSQGTPADNIVANVRQIVDKVKSGSPRTRLYLQSMLPVTDHYKKFGGHTAHWKEVADVNNGLKKIAAQENLTYVDLYSHFVDSRTGKMNIEYTNDGLHLLGKGYLKWVEIVKPYVSE